jgi:hypothetical protein
MNSTVSWFKICNWRIYEQLVVSEELMAYLKVLSQVKGEGYLEYWCRVSVSASLECEA